MEYVNKAKDQVVKVFNKGVEKYGYVKPAAVVLGGAWVMCKLLRRLGFFAKKDVKGEVVFLTGGAMGIGRQMALLLGAAGAKVAIADLNMQGAEDVAAEISEKGGIAFAVYCNVAEYDSVREAANAVRERLGSPTILINNAGIVSGRKFLQNTIEAMERTIKVNLTAHLYTLKEFLPDMIRNDHGHVVTVASMAGYIGLSGMVDYSASKFGAVGLTESLRNELKLMGSKVKTTLVNPYFIRTGMFTGVQTTLQWLMPWLDEKYVAGRVLQAIRQETEVLTMPCTGPLAISIKSLMSTEWSDSLLGAIGLNRSMDTFKGRGA